MKKSKVGQPLIPFGKNHVEWFEEATEILNNETELSAYSLMGCLRDPNWFGAAITKKIISKIPKEEMLDAFSLILNLHNEDDIWLYYCLRALLDHYSHQELRIFDANFKQLINSKKITEDALTEILNDILASG